MAVAPLRALLAHSIDYAGMFPPCNLALEPALQNHTKYIRESDSWMLSNFILPIGQFAAASGALAQFEQKHPLRVSALGSKTETIDTFRPVNSRCRCPEMSILPHWPRRLPCSVR